MLFHRDGATGRVKEQRPTGPKKDVLGGSSGVGGPSSILRKGRPRGGRDGDLHILAVGLGLRVKGLRVKG